MSKYFKADDVINLLAAEYYTYKQAEIIEVEDCKAAAEFNTKHLHAIDIVHCKDCKYRKVNEHYGEDGYFDLKAMCELDTGDIFELGRDAQIDDWFCADGERE